MPNDSAQLAPLIAIVGPTGAGKSELALTLAQSFPAEIVNFDSVQVFRGLDIGTAKTPVAERRGVPHHLIDIVEPDQVFSAGDFARHARAAIHDILGRGRLPMLVGGTGLYLRALLDGLSPAPVRDPALRHRLSEFAIRRPNLLHRYLLRYDPEAAGRIHANDLQKLIRAIELTRLAHKPASETQRQPRQPLTGVRTLKLGLNPPREMLYRKLDLRAKSMFQNGLVDETSALAQRYPVGTRLAPLDALGYRQALAVLAGELSLDDGIEQTQRRTRQYAKRQWTWFRSDPRVHWLPGFGSDSHVLHQAAELVKLHLNQTD